VRVQIGSTDPDSLERAELQRAARLIGRRSPEAIDALPLVSTLLISARSSAALGGELLSNLSSSVLSYSYWLDEFGEAEVQPCGNWTAAERAAVLRDGELSKLSYFADDEAIVLHAAQHLLGHALGARATFIASCRSGAEQRQLGAERVLRWLRVRLSPSIGISMGDDDIALGRIVSALSALTDLSPDAEVRLRSRMALDVLLHDVGVHVYKGTLPMNRGLRSGGLGGYSHSSNLVWLLTGQGTCLVGEPASASLALALLRGGYSMPRAVSEAARALEPEGPIPERDSDFNIKTRTAAKVTAAEASRLGLGYGGLASVHDCEYWMSLGGSAAPEAVECPFVLARAYGDARGPLRLYKYLRPLSNITLNITLPLDVGWLDGASEQLADATTFESPDRQPLTLLGGAMRLFSPLARGVVKSAASLYSHRYKGVTLTSLLDYQPGALAVSGRHPWTASLDPAANALVFTSQPARPAFESSAHDWWSMQAAMPRVAQWREIAISIYNPPVEASALLPFVEGTIPPQLTHAYFNKSAFDEYRTVVGRDDVTTWHCGRKGTGYVALYSYQPAAFAETGPYAGVDLLADGYRNVWIMHVGDESVDGSFDKWTNNIRKGWVNVDILPPGPDRDGGLPWCLWENECVVGFPDQIDYWRLVKCVQWIPFVNRKPVCDHTLNTWGFLGCFLKCELPDWRLCLAYCAVKSIDWSIPSATFGHVHVEYIPYFKPALEYGWEKELRVGRRYNAVRRELYGQEMKRFDTPFSQAEPDLSERILDIRTDGLSAHLDFGDQPQRVLVDQRPFS
jgi:hypothetical protein